MNLYLRPKTGRQLACVEIEGRTTEDVSWTRFTDGVDYSVRSGMALNHRRRRSFLLVRVDTFHPLLPQSIVIQRGEHLVVQRGELKVAWGDQDGTFMPLELKMRQENLRTKDWVLVVDFGNSRTSVVAICNPTEDPRPFQLLSLIDADLPRLNFTAEGEMEGDYLMRSFILFDRAEDRLVAAPDGGHSSQQDIICYIGEMARQLSLDYVVPGSAICYSPKRQLWDREEMSEPYYLTSEGQDPVPDPISGGYLRHCHVAAYFMRELFRAANQSLNRISGEDDNIFNRVHRIVFTVPAAFSMAEREELQRCAQWAAKAAGLGDHLGSDDATFVISDEANAAATYFLKTTYEAASQRVDGGSGDDGLASATAGRKFAALREKYGNPRKKGDETLTIMLVDIGAGTTDVAINQYRWIKGEMAIGRRVLQIDSFLMGGDNISEELIKLLADHAARVTEMPREVLTCNFKTTRSAREQVRRLLFERMNGYAEQVKRISSDKNRRLSREWMELRFDDITLGTTFPDHVDPYDLLQHGTLFHHGLFYVKDSLKPRRVIVEGELIAQMVQDSLARFPRQCDHLRTLADKLMPDVVILAGMSSRLPGIREIFETEKSAIKHRVVLLSELYPHDNQGMQHIATADVIQCGFDKLAVVLGAAILAAGKYYDQRPRIINEREFTQMPGEGVKALLTALEEDEEESTAFRGFYPQPRFIGIPAGSYGLEFHPDFGFNPRLNFDEEGKGTFFLPWNEGNMLSCSASFCDPRLYGENTPATMIASITKTQGGFKGVIKLQVSKMRPSEIQIMGVGRSKLSLRAPEEGEFVVKFQRLNDIHFSNHGVLITPAREQQGHAR